MTKRELVAKLIALKAERDELIEGLTDATALLIQLGAGHPHEEGGACLHCAYVEAAMKVGAPLQRYMDKLGPTADEFARDHPERYALLMRGIAEGGVDLTPEGGS